jgi:hypothetical protein
LKQCLTPKGKLQAILDSINENDFHNTSEAWEKNYRIAVYVSNVTILKMAAKIE